MITPPPSIVDLLTQKLIKRFVKRQHISRILWKKQPEDRDTIFMRSLRLLAIALSVPLPHLANREAPDTIPWYELRETHVAGLRAYFVRTLPQHKAQECMRLLIEGLTIVHAGKGLTDEEWDAIKKAAGQTETAPKQKRPTSSIAAERDFGRRRIRRRVVKRIDPVQFEWQSNEG